MMGPDAVWHGLSLTLQVSFIDLLLSGDNAIVIALACRGLPAPQVRQAILIGTGAAIGLRVLFTSMVTLLLNLPYLKLLGMAALIVIAIKLLVDEEGEPMARGAGGQNEAQATVSLWPTVSVIVVADLAMSLDNVVALAAVAQNSVFFLVLGLVLSVPLLMYGSLFVTGLFNRYPILVPAGGTLLGWVAGDIGMSDPLIADWVTTQAPILTLAMPLACAVFVLFESKIIQQNLRRFPAPATNTSAALKAVARMASAYPAAALPTTPVLPVDAQANGLQFRVERQGSSSSPIFTRPVLRYLLISAFAVPVLGVIGSIVYRGWVNDGLMPKPSLLLRYECPGSNGSYSFYFRHGRDSVQIRSNAGMLEGRLRDGKIDWANFSGGTALLGFSPPTEITYDDAKSIRVNGGSALQVDCANAQKIAAVR